MMNNLKLAAFGFALGTSVLGAAPGTAQTLPFDGTRENVNPLNPPGGRCVPPFFNTVNITPGAVSSTGTSNISTFTSLQSHCISTAPPTPLSDGRFTYTFEGGDTIFGTYTGNVVNSATPGIFTATENLIITGGTGRFVGATGTIDSSGSLVFANGFGTFQGTLTGGITASTATASGTFATAVGSPSAATGNYASAFGAFALASGDRSTALGTFAEATNLSAVAVGDNSFASGSRAVAVGQGARATNSVTVAVGNNALATGLNATAVGPFTQATGMGATALGNVAIATNLGTTALGVRSAATADNATAVGARTTAAFARSTAIGADATTTAANQVALGGAGSSVRVGDIAASTAAQEAASVGVATVDANGTLGRNTVLLGTVVSQGTTIAAQGVSIASQGAAITALQTDSMTLFDLVRDNREDIRDANEGVAMALALDSPSVPSGARFAVSGGVGYFKGRSALATAVSAAVSEMALVSAGIGYGFKSKEVGARAGFQFAW
ncbi:MAG: YadA-like family protein [Pseudomonadota bacterium]|nr:YadA-like family protein [Pseudomonadota bacterium]